MSFSNSYAQSDTTRIQINEVKFNLPGKWKRIIDREESGQFGFAEEITKVSITISARPPEKMEFYKPELQGFDLVDAFFKWDYEYWSTDQNVEVRKLTEDRKNKFIVWFMKVPKGENIILFGLKSGKIISIHLNNSNKENKMEEQTAINFLKDILLN